MTLFDAWLLIAIGLLGWLFWLWRQQSERARQQAQRYCQQQQLQLLEVYRGKGRFCRHQGRLGWLSHFQFDFSSDGESRYQGDLWMFNGKLTSIETPAYRLPN
ncbi:DUF3301 domain-containing protein [Idiomarina xiamenensis]|uniref:DUF3301 domain-containing protein n=1 Tax=Idiomarina xiamenensis 10-D-4 TaxID=740709 RepID=K2KAJ8_9GAMM|nr:DUF3301 domain-containing protein [Idiomarina xiamenensis]EKE84858.1 hypothetical protein A10D4_04580 [Idiomarina xiamenensis 10-D-4]